MEKGHVLLRVADDPGDTRNCWRFLIILGMRIMGIIVAGLVRILILRGLIWRKSTGP